MFAGGILRLYKREQQKDDDSRGVTCLKWRYNGLFLAFHSAKTSKVPLILKPNTEIG